MLILCVTMNMVINILKTLWSKYKGLVGVAAAILVFYLFLFALGITCPIKYLTGVSCPGCGMSRASVSALLFRFDAAFAYHPLWILLLPTAALLLLFHFKKMRRAFRAVILVFGTLMVAVWLYRLLLVPQSIVVFEPENGLFVRLFHQISRLLTH